MGKLDRGYEDYLEGKISDDFWAESQQAWETDLPAVEAELSRDSSSPARSIMTTAQKILELAQKAEFLYKSQSDGTASSAGYGAIELHVRSRNSLSYLQ